MNLASPAVQVRADRALQFVVPGLCGGLPAAHSPSVPGQLAALTIPQGPTDD